jgi:hypothetical protein
VGEVVELAAVAPVALPCDGSLSGVALGTDGKVRARATGGGGVLHHQDDGGESVVYAAVFPESIMLVGKDTLSFCVL